jgi:hypothetical protein
LEANCSKALAARSALSANDEARRDAAVSEFTNGSKAPGAVSMALAFTLVFPLRLLIGAY